MSLEFDLYPRSDPIGGAKLVTFAHLQAGEVKKEWQGTGSGRLMLRGDSAEAQFIDPKGLQYVRVRDTAVSATVAVAGFFTDRGDFEALTVKRTRKLTFGGAGAISILARAVMDEQTYLDSEGGKDPFDDIWRLHAQGSWIGAVPHALGSFLHRVMRECTHADRPRQPLDGVTWDFDASTDSNGTPWPAYEGEFIANVGETVLSVVQRLMQLGLIVEMDPHTFELHAYVSKGTDRTGGAWGAGVVRFQTASAGTVVTGNIKSEAKRGIEAHVVRSDILTGSQDTYEWVNDAGADIVWEGLYRIDPADSAALTAAGNAQLSARSDAGDTARLRIAYGNSPSGGRYRPITHFDVGDIGTLHSGTGAMDWDESDQLISAITWQKRRGGTTPDVFVDFGAGYRPFEDRQFQVGDGGGCICLRLCGGDPGTNVLLNLAPASIKVSSSSGAPSTAKEKAVDGDDTTPSHWTANIANGVDEEYWAGDLGAAVEVVAYRVKQGYSVTPTSPPQPEGATEMRIYGSNDAGAWSWLPSGPLVADPTANGWTQVALFTGSTTGSDTGLSEFGGGTYRYWLLRASAGPAAGTGEGWNVQEFELWDTVPTGTSTHAARCDHPHDHNDLTGRSTVTAHPASAVTETTDANVQAAIDNLRARAWKQPVRAATTAAGTLATSFENGDTIDGVVLATGDRILLKNQAAGAENGIYTVNASGAPTRGTDMDASAEVLGAAVLVSEGTANADKVFICTTNAPITLGTTTLVFAELSGGGSTLQVGSVTPVDNIAFPGATVNDLGAGDVSVVLPDALSAKASATADLAPTTGTAADVTGATHSLAPGTYIAIGVFQVELNSGDRVFEGVLDVGGTDENDLAIWEAVGADDGDEQQVVQVWRIVLASTTTVKLQARHSGGTTGDFDVKAANTTLTVFRAGGRSVTIAQATQETAVTISSGNTLVDLCSLTIVAAPAGLYQLLANFYVNTAGTSNVGLETSSGGAAFVARDVRDCRSHAGERTLMFLYTHTGGDLAVRLLGQYESSNATLGLAGDHRWGRNLQVVGVGV